MRRDDNSCIINNRHLSSECRVIRSYGTGHGAPELSFRIMQLQRPFRINTLRTCSNVKSTTGTVNGNTMVLVPENSEKTRFTPIYPDFRVDVWKSKEGRGGAGACVTPRPPAIVPPAPPRVSRSGMKRTRTSLALPQFSSRDGRSTTTGG